jgi:hypothetical protein
MISSQKLWPLDHEADLFHKVSAAKSTPSTPPLLQQENATVKYQFSNYNGNIHWHLCFPLFHFSVSWCTLTQYSTQQTQHLVILIMIQASALSAVLHVLALTGNGLNCWVANRHKHEYTVKKKRSWRNTYSRKKDICLWSHIVLNREINVCTHSFPLL